MPRRNVAGQRTAAAGGPGRRPRRRPARTPRGPRGPGRSPARGGAGRSSPRRPRRCTGSRRGCRPGRSHTKTGWVPSAYAAGSVGRNQNTACRVTTQRQAEVRQQGRRPRPRGDDETVGLDRAASRVRTRTPLASASHVERRSPGPQLGAGRLRAAPVLEHGPLGPHEPAALLEHADLVVLGGERREPAPDLGRVEHLVREAVLPGARQRPGDRLGLGPAEEQPARHPEDARDRRARGPPRARRRAGAGARTPGPRSTPAG